MEDMKNLARTLLKYKSYKERHVKLSESIDRLSFDYPIVYSLFHRELKKREIESNDPNKIPTWLNSSNCHEKIHGALILVKSNNIIAKDEYLECLKRMLIQTIENGTNIKETLKICHLIEKSAHLASIYDQLKCLIQRVYQIDDNKKNSGNESQSNYMWSDNSNQVLVDPLNSLKINCDRPQHIPVWPTMQQTSYIQPFNEYPVLNFDYYGNRCSMFESQSSLFNITIISQGMDGAFDKWLRYLKLHKYQWFFKGLSYLEIECIDEDNIEAFVSKVNKNSITKGAQKKICLSTKILRERKQKMDEILLSLDLEVTPVELCEYMTYMVDILHYPIPNKHCVAGDQLQRTIASVMEKLFIHLMEKLGKIRFLVSQSLIGTSINKFLECTLLIIGNQTFMREQVDKARELTEKLKCQVRRMPKNFY